MAGRHDESRIGRLPRRFGGYGAVMLEVLDLTKRYGTNLAVDRLSFTARPGRVREATRS